MRHRVKKSTRIIALLIVLSVILSTGVLLVYLSQYQTNPSSTVLSNAAPTPTPFILPNGKFVDVVFQSRTYRIHMLPIPDQSHIRLIPNFEGSSYGIDIVQSARCTLAINGGFYTGSKKPLGLFITDGKILGKRTQSNVANGFLWLDRFGSLRMERQPLDNTFDAEFILQSGPFIPVTGKRMSMIKDDFARRSLIGEDDNNHFYLLSASLADESFSGPLLGDIPIIFSLPQVQAIIPIKTVLNLDGGSTSFYYSKGEAGEFVRSELAPVGSIICVK
jgi:exopolysaccharide biosynthesis protein